MFTSSKDKTLNKQFRSLLSFTLFHKLDKAMRTPNPRIKPFMCLEARIPLMSCLAANKWMT